MLHRAAQRLREVRRAFSPGTFTQKGILAVQPTSPSAVTPAQQDFNPQVRGRARHQRLYFEDRLKQRGLVRAIFLCFVS
jgi:hypothetical protein